MQIELSIRTADLSSIVDAENLSNCIKNSKKNLLFLFNEYKIVLENVLFENNIPYNFSNDKIECLNFHKTLHTNIEDSFTCKIKLSICELFLFGFMGILCLKVTINNIPDNILVTEHKFKSLDQFDSNVNFLCCRYCNVNASWSKLVYVRNTSLIKLKFFKLIL